MDPVQEVVEFSTMRAPKDVIRMIDVLATAERTSIQGFNDTTLRAWVTRLYKAWIAKQAKQPDADPAFANQIELGEAGA